MKRLMCVLIFLGLVTSYSAANPSSLLEEANEAYKRSEYGYAAELYEQILLDGFSSAALLYNLGNAHYKNNRIGLAILNYERALKLKPLDEDIMHNLEVARNRTIDRLEQRPLLFYERWYMSAWSLQSVDGWGITIIVFVVLFLLATALYLFSRTLLYKKSFFYLMLFFFVLAMLSALFARKQYKRLYSQKEAIVLQPRVTAKSSPSSQSPDLFLMHEGTKIFIRNNLGNWYEISLPNGNVGWIREEAMEII
jgi:tetratricopeptide (TPR) repeat protein